MEVKQLITDFKLSVEQNGHKFKWVLKRYGDNGLSYNAFTLQLNGFSSVSQGAKDIMNDYLKDNPLAVSSE